MPDQNPADIAAKVAAAVSEAAFAGIIVTVVTDAGSRPMVTSIDHPAIRAAARAVAAVFGKNPVFTREGGSIPAVESFARLMGMPAVLLGDGLADDGVHAPNARFDLSMYAKGVRVFAHLWDELAVPLSPSRQ